MTPWLPIAQCSLDACVFTSLYRWMWREGGLTDRSAVSWRLRLLCHITHYNPIPSLSFYTHAHTREHTGTHTVGRRWLTIVGEKQMSLLYLRPVSDLKRKQSPARFKLDSINLQMTSKRWFDSTFTMLLKVKSILPQKEGILCKPKTRDLCVKEIQKSRSN